jgi:acetyl-CoA acetyltransferase
MLRLPWCARTLTPEQLAMVSVVQREWAAKNPRATFKTPITVEDVLNSSSQSVR